MIYNKLKKIKLVISYFNNAFNYNNHALIFSLIFFINNKFLYDK